VKRTVEELRSAVTLTVPEVAHSLGISEAQVRKWVKSGVIPVLDVPGTRQLIPREAFEQWLADRVRAPRR
jgi:excisionase family DNA binding protein